MSVIVSDSEFARAARELTKAKSSLVSVVEGVVSCLEDISYEGLNTARVNNALGENAASLKEAIETATSAVGPIEVQTTGLLDDLDSIDGRIYE